VSKIIFNYKICDKAAECGAISECPTGAIYYDKNLNKPVWDKSKCTFCLKCTLPDVCPVSAVLFAKDDQQEAAIMESINSDNHSEEWLWLERYGVVPSISNPIAIILNPGNFEEIIRSSKSKIIDIWHYDFLNCRLHSPLYSDLIKDVAKISIYKLDAQKYPELAVKLGVSTYPSLLVYSSGKLIDTINGYLTEKQVKVINKKIKLL